MENINTGGKMLYGIDMYFAFHYQKEEALNFFLGIENLAKKYLQTNKLRYLAGDYVSREMLITILKEDNLNSSIYIDKSEYEDEFLTTIKFFKEQETLQFCIFFQKKYSIKAMVSDIFALFEKQKFFYGYALESDTLDGLLSHNICQYWEGITPEKENSLFWRGEYHYKNGLLRYVYHLNFISQHTLNLKVYNGETLNEWILKNHYGILIDIGKGAKIWEVPDEKLNEINDFLGESGIVVTWIKPKPPRRLP